MKPLVRNLLIGGTIVVLLLIQVCRAQAAVSDCASQEGCIALLQNGQVVIYRKGVLKGTIGQVGDGSGIVSSSNGWLIVTHTSDPDVYLYEIETDYRFDVMLSTPCAEGIVFKHPTDVNERYAFLACPFTNEVTSIKLDNTGTFMLSTNGTTPYSITIDEDRFYCLNSVEASIRNWSQLHLNGSMAYNTGITNGNIIRYWDNGVDPAQLFFNSQDFIYAKNLPVSDGVPATFYTLPAGTGAGHMAVSDTHILVSSVNGNDAYLIDIVTTSHITLPVTDSREVALSSDTAFVIEVGGQVVVQAFDTGSGTPLYTINETCNSIAYLKPTLPPVCENGLVEPGETCDSTDFDGIGCQDYGFDGGELSCSVSCDTIFTSGCWSCGDGTLNPGESCDGTDFGTASCVASGYENGDVTCTASCTVDYSQCYTCGNGLIEGAEECEGADLNGQTCASAGFVDGTISCGTDCFFDTSACHMCGNAITDTGETCDGTDTPGMICQTLDLGYTGGELVCTSTCDGLDDSGCYTCGDGDINATEECDGVNLNSQDCGTLDLGSGTLSCFENCTFNLTQCNDVSSEYCGNEVVDPGEECDDGNRSNNDDCSEFCKIIPPTCGFGGVDPGESCDGTDLSGETCETLGYQAGVLYCGDDCQFRTDDCHFTSTPQTISLQLDAEPESGELDEILMSQYEILKSTLTPNCISQDVNGDLVITTTEGSYCAVRATDLNSPEGKKMFSFIHIPENALENEDPVIRFYQNGNIAQNFGGHITAYQGLEVRTVLVQDYLYQITQERISSMGMQFLAIHPETQSRGRWLAVTIGNGSTTLYAGETQAHIVPDQGRVIINLDALEDLSAIDWKPPKNSDGCSCQAGGSNHPNSFPLIMLVAMFLFWRRRRNR